MKKFAKWEKTVRVELGKSQSWISNAISESDTPDPFCGGFYVWY